MARTIPASEFKAKCLALLDEVAETRETIVVTKRGKPVARVEPASGGGRVVEVVTADPEAACCPSCGTLSTSPKQNVVTRPKDLPRSEWIGWGVLLVQSCRDRVERYRFLAVGHRFILRRLFYPTGCRNSNDGREGGLRSHELSPPPAPSVFPAEA